MKRPQRHGDGRTHGSGGRGEESAMGLNVFRDEARAFVAALGTAAAAGMVVLLATPVVAALRVGYRALRTGDARLVWVVSGIILTLIVSSLVQLYR